MEQLGSTSVVAFDETGTLIRGHPEHLPPLPLGVAGHEGSTVIVGLNGLRLLFWRAWRAWRISRAKALTTSRGRPRVQAATG